MLFLIGKLPTHDGSLAQDLTFCLKLIINRGGTNWPIAYWPLNAILSMP